MHYSLQKCFIIEKSIPLWDDYLTTAPQFMSQNDHKYEIMIITIPFNKFVYNAEYNSIKYLVSILYCYMSQCALHICYNEEISLMLILKQNVIKERFYITTT